MSKDSVRYGRVPKRSRERNDDSRVTQSEADQSNQIPENKENKELAMYDLVLSITQAHHSNSGYTEDRTRGLVRKPAAFSLNEFQSNSNDGQTTVDSLEQQKIVMWQQFASLLTPSIQRTVEFAKHVPGFLDLTQDDQLILIKLGFFEIWLVQVAKMVDTMDSTLTFCDGSFVSRQQMEFMFDHEFVSMVFNFLLSLNSLQMSDSEIALYSAIVLFTSERPGIYDHKAIEQQREKFLEAFKFQMNRHRASAPHVFATLVMKLPELRNVGEKHMEHLQWFRANWMHLQLPPLFAELFDIPRSEQDLAQ